MELALLALRQDATARILRELRLRLASASAMEQVANAARALVEDVRRHASENGVPEDEADLDDDLWRSLRATVDQWMQADGER